MFEQSKWFFNEFNMLFKKGSIYQEKAIECYAHNTEFTDFIIERINAIIASKNYFSQNEYFRIDAMGYTTKWKSLKKIKGFNPHLWDLQIAVEHENDSKDWLDEVIKLAHVYCPLRVVIGYVPVKNRDSADEKLLNYSAKALQLLQCKDNLKSGEFMVVLGNSGTKKPDDYFNYRAYVLNPETLTFENLEKYN